MNQIFNNNNHKNNKKMKINLKHKLNDNHNKNQKMKNLMIKNKMNKLLLILRQLIQICVL